MAIEYRASNGRKGLSTTFAAVSLNPVSGLAKSADIVILAVWACLRNDRIDQRCFSCFWQLWVPFSVLVSNGYALDSTIKILYNPKHDERISHCQQVKPANQQLAF